MKELIAGAFFSVITALTAAVVACAVPAHAQRSEPSIAFTFTAFDYPEALATQALGINKAGVIVGYYVDTSLVSHGFGRLPNGTFEKLDYPGSVETLLFGVNNSNQVVGFYSDTDTLDQGFLFTSPDHFTPIDYPGSDMTTAYGINNSGQIVGAWGEPPSQG